MSQGVIAESTLKRLLALHDFLVLLQTTVFLGVCEKEGCREGVERAEELIPRIVPSYPARPVCSAVGLLITNG